MYAIAVCSSVTSEEMCAHWSTCVLKNRLFRFLYLIGVSCIYCTNTSTVTSKLPAYMALKKHNSLLTAFRYVTTENVRLHVLTAL